MARERWLPLSEEIIAAHQMADHLHMVDLAEALAFQREHGGPMEITMRAGETQPDWFLAVERREGELYVLMSCPLDELGKSA